MLLRLFVLVLRRKSLRPTRLRTCTYDSVGRIIARHSSLTLLVSIFSMFSICRFHEVTGSYPEKITIVSFTFKQRRFETMHAAALQWPLHHFSYLGVDPPAAV